MRLVWVIVAVMAVGHVSLLLWLLRDAGAGYVDFSAFYTAGKLVRQQPNALYDFHTQTELRNTLLPDARRKTSTLPFYHPAFELLIYSPLSSLSYRSAYLTWIGTSLAILGLAILWLRRMIPLTAYGALLLSSFAFFPATVTLLLGQDSILLLAIYAAAYVLLASDRPLISGVVLALGLFKFHLVLPFVIIMAAQRRWRFLRGFAVGAAVVTIASVALAGMAATRQFIEILWHFDNLTQQATSTVDSQMPSIGGLLTTLWSYTHLGHLGRLPIAVVSLAIVGVAAYLARNAGNALELTFAFGLLTAVLAGHHVNTQDLTLLLPALLVLGSRAMRLNHRLALAAIALLWCSPLHLYLLGHTSLTFLAVPIGVLFVFAASRLRDVHRDPEGRAQTREPEYATA